MLARQAILKASKATYATAAYQASNGIKVFSTEESGQTAALALVVKGGARAESKEQAGVAHFLKNYGFKNNANRTAFRIAREAELAGGVLSANLTHESLVYSAEFLKEDVALFANLLGDILQQKYQEHEFIDVAHQTAGESANALSTPEIVALEAAHQVAFRSGLGNSIFAKRSARVNNATVKSFAQQVFTQDNVALVGSGISHEVLADLAESFVTLPQGSSLAGTQYHGGESRIESSGQSQFVLGFQGAAANTKEYAALEVLRQALGGEVFVKTTAGSGLLASAAAKFSQGTSLKAFNLGYSDAGLFGIQIAADSSEIASAAAAAAEQLKALSAGLDGAEFERAVNQAKYATLAGLETRLDRVQTVGTQALFGQVATSSEAAAAVAAVTAADVSEVASKLLSSKSTSVALGDLARLPYADSLSL